MAVDKAGLALLTYAHAGRVDLLGEAAVEYWGQQVDTARASAPLLSEAQLGDIVQAFAHAHAAEALFAEAAWTAMGAGSVVQLDSRYPLPREMITLRGAAALFYALDGDAPTEAELYQTACAAHADRLAAARKRRRRMLAAQAAELEGRAMEEEEEDDVEEDDDEEEEDDGDGPPLTDLQGRALPQEPWRGLQFAEIVQLRVRRDASLTPTRPAALALAAASLPAERRRVFPTAGLARLPHVVTALRGAFRDVRKVLVQSVLESLRSVGGGREAASLLAARGQAVEERVASVPAADLVALLQRTDPGRRALSFPLAVAGAGAAPRGAGSPFVTTHSVLEQLGRSCTTGHVTWVQISAAVRSCGACIAPPTDMPAAGAVFGGASTSPPPSLSFPSLAARPPALHSLVPADAALLAASAPAAAAAAASPSKAAAAAAAAAALVAANAPMPLVVLDVATSLLTNSVIALTSDGMLTAYDASTLTRKWLVSALPARAARALHWLRQTRLPFLHVLACAAEAAAPGAAPASTNAEAAGSLPSGLQLLAASPESHGQVVVNSSAAAYALRLAAETDPQAAAAFADASDPWAQALLELSWHSDAPACGQLVGRATPRVLADSELWTFGLVSGGQHRVHVAAGTAFALLEFVYVADAHLLVGSAVPISRGGLPGSAEAAAAVAQFLESEGPHQVPGSTTLSWPRIMAFDALTGACVADLGPLSAATTTGCHIVYVAASRHIIAADFLPLPEAEAAPKASAPAAAAAVATPVGKGKAAGGTGTSAAAASATRARPTTPVLKVWDLAPVIAVAARQRAAFLQAATSPDRAAAASTSLLNMSSASMGLNQTLSVTGALPGAGLDELVPQVLALPHALLLDVMSQGRGGRGGAAAPAFAPGAAVAALRSLPHSGMLAVAQADGRLSLWDARHRRQRLHFPPTSAFSAPDYHFTDADADTADAEDDDARWTALPSGCHKATRLKLSVYYRPAGLLQTTLAPAALARAGFDGRLVRELETEPAAGNRPAATVSVPATASVASPAPMHIGLASVPGGLHASLRASRPPCAARRLALAPAARPGRRGLGGERQPRRGQPLV